MDVENCNINLLDNYMGQELTYKELCNILDIKYYSGGTSKTRQLKYIQCYYSIEKVKTKYKIISRLDEPLEYEDKRRSIYYNDLESIILFILDNVEGNQVSWSMSKALKLTAMINSNYTVGRLEERNTCRVLEVKEETLSNFYLMTYSKLKNIFNHALDIMEDKRLIHRSEGIMICKKETNILYNDLHEPVINEYGRIEYDVIKVYREATLDEIVAIQDIEKETLSEMNFISIRDCFVHKQWNKYRNAVNKKLRERCNIEYSYKAYNIIKNTKWIKKEVEDNIDIMQHKDNLNKLVIDALYNSKDKLLPEDIEDRDILVDALINIHTTLDLKNIIKNILKLEQEEERDILPF